MSSHTTPLPSPMTGAADRLLRAAAGYFTNEGPSAELDLALGGITLGVTMRARPSANIKPDSLLFRTTPIIRTTIVLGAQVWPEEISTPDMSSVGHAMVAAEWAHVAMAIASDAADGADTRSVLSLFANPIPQWADDLTLKARAFTLGAHNPTGRIATVGLLVADAKGHVFDVPDALFWVTFNFGVALAGTEYEVYSPEQENTR